MIQSTYLPVLLAGLLAAAGAQAQTSPASGSSDAPVKAGEASTQTQGVPNAKTTNSPVSEAPAATQSMGAAAGPAMTPHKLTRAEVIGELMNQREWYNAQKGIGHRRGTNVGMASGSSTQ